MNKGAEKCETRGGGVEESKGAGWRLAKPRVRRGRFETYKCEGSQSEIDEYEVEQVGG